LVGTPFALDGGNNSLQSPPLLTLEVTSRFPDSAHQNPSRRIRLGLLGVAMGLAAVAMSLRGDLGGKLGTPLGRLFEGTVGVMMALGGGWLIRAGVRKRRRRAQARMVQLPDSFPPEAYQLGTPLALHQPGYFGRVASVLAGLFVIAMGGICVAMILRKQVTDHRFIGIAFMAPAAGFCLLWQGVRNHGLRI